MWPYWMLFFVAAAMALMELKLVPQGRALEGAWIVVLVLLVLMVGFRHQVGGDWDTYIDHLDLVANLSFSDAVLTGDPAYSFLNWLAPQFGFEVYFVNLACAVIFSWGLVVFCRNQPFPWLALVVAVPYLIMVVAMGYTRQGVAIGLAMLGLVALGQGSVLRFVLWMAVAAAFHKSAVVLVPLAALANADGRGRFVKVILVGVSALVLYQLLLQESVDDLRSGYIDAAYQSSGAAIRITMNAVPAILFLGLRKRFELPAVQRVFWTWIALSGLSFVVLLQISASSTAVDRVALYWIPLQLFVFSRLPIALGAAGRPGQMWIFFVVGYSALVQFVWLIFADTAFAWLPYQFYPFVLLFE